MNIIYLWQNRERPRMFRKRWFKVWAKRALNLRGLLNIYANQIRYKISGSRVGNLTVIGKLDIHGPKKLLTIGERCFISTGVHLAMHAPVIIGNRVVVNGGVRLLTGSHLTTDSKWLLFGKPIIIEDYAWIATDAIILPGVKIGKGAVVAAGAVISRDVPDHAVVAGNPAKVVSQRSKELFYSPVDLCAPFEAWLGNPEKADYSGRK
jgi:acetyltransferase-like isoleucine patch superfamily enzyme